MATFVNKIHDKSSPCHAEMLVIAVISLIVIFTNDSLERSRHDIGSSESFHQYCHLLSVLYKTQIPRTTCMQFRVSIAMRQTIHSLSIGTYNALDSSVVCTGFAVVSDELESTKHLADGEETKNLGCNDSTSSPLCSAEVAYPVHHVCWSRRNGIGEEHVGIPETLGERLIV